MSTPALRVTAVTSVGGAGDPGPPTEILRYAAAVAALGEGPVAHAIVVAAADQAEGEAAVAAATGQADGEAVDGDRPLDGDGAPEPAHPLLEVSGFVAHPGGGVEGLVRRAHAGLGPGGMLNTRRVLVGRPDWLAEHGVTVPPEASAVVVGQAEAVAVAWTGAVRGVITLRTAPSGRA